MATNEETALAVAEENPFALMDRLDDMQTLASVDPAYAAQMVAGVRPDALVYVVPSKGGEIVGLSTRGAQVLAARRGGFETLADYRLDEVVSQVSVTVGFEERKGRNGPYKAPIKEPQDCRGIRIFVRVKDMRNDMTFIGVAEQPLVMALRDGGTEPDPHAFIKAFNKAERNALRKHFAAFEDMVVQFAEEARRAGKAYVTGEVADRDLAAAAEVRSNIIRLQVAQAEKLGPDRAAAFQRRRAQVIEEYQLDAAALAERSKAYIKRSFGVDKLADVPASAEADLYAWLDKQIPLDRRPEAGTARAVTEEGSESEPEPQPEPEPSVPSLPDEADMLREYLSLAVRVGGMEAAEARKAWKALEGPDAQLAALEDLRAKAAAQPGLDV